MVFAGLESHDRMGPGGPAKVFHRVERREAHWTFDLRLRRSAPQGDHHLTRRATTRLSIRRQTGIEHMYVSIGIDGDQGRVVGPTTEPVRIGVDLPVGSDGNSRRTKNTVDAR